MKDNRGVSKHRNLHYFRYLTATVLVALTCCLYGQPSSSAPLKTATGVSDLAQANATKAEADRLFQTGIQQFRRSQFREALESYQQVLRLRREIGDKAGEGETLINIGVVYRVLGQYPQAKASLEQALEIAKSLNNRTLTGRTFSEIGVVYYSLSQYPQALDFYQQAIAISREISDRTVEAHTLDHMGVVYRRQGRYNQALELHQQALGISREIGDRAVQARILNNIGVVYDSLGQYSKALEFDQQGLVVSRDVGDRFIEARILDSIGVAYGNQGQYSQALQFYQQALSIRREIGDKQGQGNTLNNLGALYDSQGEYSQALESHQQALTIRQSIGDRIGEGITLGNIGLVYWNWGRYPQALEYYQQALAVSRDIGDRPGEGYILSSIGGVYYTQGQYSKALESYQQALAMRKEIGDKAGIGSTLNSIGGVYYSLGQYPQALDFYQQALAIRREIGDKAGEGTTLNNIGLVYDLQGQNTQALEFYQQALTIRQDIGDKSGEGNTLNNIGLIYNLLNQNTQALEIFKRSLAIRQEIGDKAGEGTTLNNLGLIYENTSQYPQALESYQQALGIFQAIGNRAGERQTLSNLGNLLSKQNQPELAIVFYKQSINVTEAIRRDLQPLSREQKASYTQTVADSYRALADLLLQENRVLEAQQVLDLLKVQELDDYLRNVRGNEQTAQGIELLPQEQQILENYTAIQNKALQLGNELTQLRQIPAVNRTQAQVQRIAELEQIQQGVRQEFNDFIRSPEVVTRVQQLNQTSSGQNLDLPNLNRLQRSLRQIKPNAVILYPLILKDRIELVLVTPDGLPIHRPVPVKQEDLNRVIVEFSSALTNRRDALLKTNQAIAQIKVPARQLYDWLIKPIENDLTRVDAQTIIYAPDSQLRYIPLAALYDGRQWLVQRFGINNITAATLTDFKPQSLAELRILAAAFTQGNYQFQMGKSQFAFSGLPFAALEVDNIAAKFPSTVKLLDSAFNRAATVPQLNDHNIVHLATHAAFVPGQPEDSFILFGDGDRATLRDVEKWNLSEIDLVVLSACQTALGGQLGDGEEILGLGYQLQQAGALAIIASLWSVDDEGTQVLMDAFYEALGQGNRKAEALRQAQLALITGDGSMPSDQRGSIAVQQQIRNSVPPQVTNRLRHPYYWAPFILIGNGF